MELKDQLLSYLVKEGPSMKNGNRSWDISHRKFLYMNSELVEKFLEMRAHPRYRELVIDKEIDLLKKAAEILKEENGKENFSLIDLGSGDGLKTKSFLESIKDCNCNIKFCPSSVSEELVKKTLENVKSSGFENVKDYCSKIACFEELDSAISEVRSSDYQKSVVLLLGSILASFDINEYLFNTANAMFPGDYLIIGNGVRQGERLVNADQYKHEVFKNWTFPLMKELGFSENEVEYDVRFNTVRIELVYRIRKNKEIDFEGRKIEFKEGDEIMVAKLYKYFPEELEKFCKLYFSDVKIVMDSEKEYAIAVCKK